MAACRGRGKNGDLWARAELYNLGLSLCFVVSSAKELFRSCPVQRLVLLS